MTDEKQITETIYDSNYLNYTELMELINKVPEPYRESINLESDDHYYDYESTPSKVIVITYKRPETGAEFVKRQKAEEHRMALIKEHELADLKRLQEKYK